MHHMMLGYPNMLYLAVFGSVSNSCGYIIRFKENVWFVNLCRKYLEWVLYVIIIMKAPWCFWWWKWWQVLMMKRRSIEMIIKMVLVVVKRMMINDDDDDNTAWIEILFQCYNLIIQSWFLNWKFSNKSPVNWVVNIY